MNKPNNEFEITTKAQVMVITNIHFVGNVSSMVLLKI